MTTVILKDGICSVFTKSNTAAAGRKPVYSYTLKHKGFFGKLDFVTAPKWATEYKEDINVSLKIRILQNTAITNHDVVVLADVNSVTPGAAVYDVVRVYHGTEKETGRMISDVSLEAIR